MRQGARSIPAWMRRLTMRCVARRLKVSCCMVLPVLLALVGEVARAQGAVVAWHPVSAHTHASFRGLSVARDGTVWVGGTHGTVIHSTDGGVTWSTDSVPGAGAFDFRGVAAIDTAIAYVVVSSTATARIYKTTDHGRSWQLQFRTERPGVFLDGIGCWSERRCLAAGDPIAGRYVIMTTDDGGSHWTMADTARAPTARVGEAAFAASNSTVIVGSDGRAWIATGGGPTARVWRSSDYGTTWRVADTPIAAASATSGIFSLAFCDDRHGIAVGGNYSQPDSTGAHVAVSTDGGENWSPGDRERVTPYLSGAACAQPEATGTTFVAVGPKGILVGASDGVHWTRASQEGFNAVAALGGQRLIAVGDTGLVATGQLNAGPSR